MSVILNRSDTRLLRDLVLEAVSRLTPRMPTEIHEKVERDFGEVNVRAVERALLNLKKCGKIVRDSEGYLRAKHNHMGTCHG